MTPGQLYEQRAGEIIAMLTEAGMGKPGKANTVWAMVKEACDELQRLRAAALRLTDAMTKADLNWNYIGPGIYDAYLDLEKAAPKAEAK